MYHSSLGLRCEEGKATVMFASFLQCEMHPRNSYRCFVLLAVCLSGVSPKTGHSENIHGQQDSRIEYFIIIGKSYLKKQTTC